MSLLIIIGCGVRATPRNEGSRRGKRQDMGRGTSTQDSRNTHLVLVLPLLLEELEPQDGFDALLADAEGLADLRYCRWWRGRLRGGRGARRGVEVDLVDALFDRVGDRSRRAEGGIGGIWLAEWQRTCRSVTCHLNAQTTLLNVPPRPRANSARCWEDRGT